jgi:hypothetical protein
MSYRPDNQVRNGLLEPQQHLPNSGPIKGDPLKLTTSWPPSSACVSTRPAGRWRRRGSAVAVSVRPVGVLKTVGARLERWKSRTGELRPELILSLARKAGDRSAPLRLTLRRLKCLESGSDRPHTQPWPITVSPPTHRFPSRTAGRECG